MEIRLLRYFWTVAEEKSFTKAAQLLYITQPTLSRQIKELEEELGMSLFTREKKQFKLTETGLFLKERAEEILQLNDKLENTLREMQNQLLSGSITIGCVEADNSGTLALMLEELLRDYPQIQFNLVSGVSDDIIDKLEKGLLDVALVLAPLKKNSYEKIVLPRAEKWGLLVSSNSFLAQKKVITPEDLRGTPLLSSNREEVRCLIREWAKTVHQEFNIVGHFDLIFNVFSLVENGVGSALTLEGSIMNRLSEDLVFIPLSPPLNMECQLIWKKERRHTQVAEEFIQRFRQSFLL